MGFLNPSLEKYFTSRVPTAANDDRLVETREKITLALHHNNVFDMILWCLAKKYTISNGVEVDYKRVIWCDEHIITAAKKKKKKSIMATEYKRQSTQGAAQYALQ